jgi:hypothetical protein
MELSFYEKYEAKPEIQELLKMELSSYESYEEEEPVIKELLKKSIIIGKIIDKAIENNDIELMARMLKKNKEMLMEIHLNMEEIMLDEQGEDYVYLDWCNRMKKLNDKLDKSIMLITECY